jgi:hypothetical protein
VGASQKFLDQAIVLSYDAEWLMKSDFAISNHAGFEVWIQKVVALRGGWDKNNPTFGASFKISSYKLDYSYEFTSDGLGDFQRVAAEIGL